MADELTLTTEQVRRMVGVAAAIGLRDWGHEFDRWLAAHDREATAKMRGAVEAVRLLHHTEADDEGFLCVGCGEPGSGPCPTLVALDPELFPTSHSSVNSSGEEPA